MPAATAHDLEPAAAQVHVLPSQLHVYLRRYPPLVRLFLGGSIGEKRVVVFLRRDSDREQLEALLRQRAFVDEGGWVGAAV